MADESSARSTVTRRTFVAALAAGTAGCGRFGSREGSQSTPTDTAWSTPTDDAEPTGTVTGTSTPDGRTVVWNVASHLDDGGPSAIRDALREAGGLADGITVRITEPTYDTVTRLSRLKQRLAGGESRPDLFTISYRDLPVLRDLGYLRPVSALAPDAARAADSHLGPIRRASESVDGDTLFGLPLFVDLPTVMYRRDLAEAAGYSPGTDGWATEPMSWREWSQVIADVRDHAGVDYGFTTQWDRYIGTACCSFNEVLSSWGGAYFGGRETLFGPVGQRPVTVDEAPVVESLRMMQRFVDGTSVEGFEGYAPDIAPAAVLDWTEEPSREPVAAGRAVAHRNWPYALRRMGGPDGPFGRDLGAMPLPYARASSDAQAPAADGTTAALGGFVVAVNPHSDRHEAVRAVLDAMAEPAFLRFYAAFAGTFPPDLSLWADGLGSVPDRYLPTLRVAAENAVSQPATRVWSRQARAVADRANAAVAGEQSAAAAMAELAETLSTIEREA
ncbi:extracellular solute-binding protein [Haloarcula pelagica]|uniref:extracellular solute-binding protein n=1 Tax=Haloarcula pelagica TaxID=3033389 RepID=UPI0024C32BEA|nr:extracellular solute-binding protein [Halomicroarcula sp. YJ-61-S]